MVKALLDWLCRTDPSTHADAVFVLAGHKSRKVFAIQLLKQGIAPRVLFSVGRFEIRRFPELGLPQTVDLLQMAQNIPPPQRHFFVLFENGQFNVQPIPVRTLGTLSEMDALADWLDAHPQISTLLIVSSGRHLRRLRICSRALLPRTIRTSFAASPEENATLNQRDSWNDARACKVVLYECIKIACYSLFLPFWKLARPRRSKPISSISSR
jgi:hypothetical protein